MSAELPTVSRLVDAFVKVTIPGWFADFEKDRPGQGYCIEAAKIGRAALARLGVDSRPLPCGIVVANSEAVQLTNDEVPIADWPDSAWSVGIDPDRRQGGPGWDGHVLLAGDGWIADLSAAQFRRRQLDVEPWCAPTPSGWDGRELVQIANDGRDVVIAVWPRPELAAWRNTAAWRQRIPDLLLAELLASVDQLEAAP